MQTNPNRALFIGAICSGIACLAHLGCIIFGGDWYRFFGAGEQMALLAEQGHPYPTVVTLVISTVIGLWCLYGFSGAGVIKQLPFLRFALCVITAIYLVRGVGFYFIMPYFPGNSSTFWAVSSSICFTIGIFYLVGTCQIWRQSRNA